MLSLMNRNAEDSGSTALLIESLQVQSQSKALRAQVPSVEVLEILGAFRFCLAITASQMTATILLRIYKS